MNSANLLSRLHSVCPTLAARLEPGRPLRACGLDSLEFVDLLCAIEAEFRVRLNNEDLKPETTVDDLVALIATRAA